MQEIWKDIFEWEGLYHVSNLGNIKSLPKERNSGLGKYVTKEKNKKLQLNKKTGYFMIMLNYKGRVWFGTVHRLVAKAFIPNPENKPNVNHINGIKTDNKVDNLEWCTQSENLKHAFLIGLSYQNCPYKKKIINEETKVVYSSITEAASLEGIKRSTLKAMLTGQNPNKTKLIYYKNLNLI